tara:strand:- start:18 stop:782 length:765 start_codon:yes stop_codon:yes gene_type:complete
MKRKNEKGFALILSLVLLLVMSLMGGALIVISSTDHQSNNSSDEYQQAFYVAETALLEAEKSVINKMMGPWVNVDTEFQTKPTGMTSGEEEEWDSMVENITNAAVGGLSRNTDKRDLPTNIIAVTDTPCYNSFRNITRAGFLVTEHQVNKNFGTLINAVFTDGDLDNLTDSTTRDRERIYMQRFRYEYFITNIGSAQYRGVGSSIKKTSTNAQTSGTAYKIYGCGYMMPNGTALDEFENPNILVPLETVIVLSN